MALIYLQPFTRDCTLIVPSGGPLEATLCNKDEEAVDTLVVTTESELFYSIDCTSDPTPLVNFVNAIHDDDNKSIMKSILTLPATNPRIVPFSILYDLVRDEEGRYLLKENHARAIVVQSRAVGPKGAIYDKKCPCCNIWSPEPPFVYMRFQHCAGVPGRAHTACASCVWQNRGCHEMVESGVEGSGDTVTVTRGRKRKLSDILRDDVLRAQIDARWSSSPL